MKFKLGIIAFFLCALIGFAKIGVSQWSDEHQPFLNILCFEDLDTAGTLAGGVGGIFLRFPRQYPWTPLKANLPNPVVEAIATLNGKVFIATSSGSYGINRSVLRGDWTSVTPKDTFSAFYSLVVKDTDLYAGTKGAIFKSSNNGANWVRLDFGSPNTVRSFAIAGQNIFALTDNGVFVSTDDGATWAARNAGLPTDYHKAISVNSIFALGNRVYAATLGGLYIGAPDGNSWIMYDNVLAAKNVCCLASRGPFLFAGTVPSGFYYSGDSGVTWKTAGKGFPNIDILSMTVTKDEILAGTSTGDVWSCQLSEIGLAGVEGNPPIANSISVTPNPTTGVISVSNISNLLQVLIVDVLGQEVMRVVPNHESSLTLDLSQLPRGNYFARFVTTSSVVTRMIVKK